MVRHGTKIVSKMSLHWIEPVSRLSGNDKIPLFIIWEMAPARIGTALLARTRVEIARIVSIRGYNDEIVAHL